MKKYRFKTEEEFIKEFGDNWRCSIDIFWITEMDYLIGTEYPHDIDINKYTKEIPSINRRNNMYDRWAISKKFITEKQKIPDYSPRKLNRSI